MDRYEPALLLPGDVRAFTEPASAKSSPAADGLIDLDLASAVTVWPLNAGTTFEARVAAIGTGGTGESAPSNAFAFTASCTYMLSTTAISVAPAGGIASVAIIAPAGCAERASNAAWITLTGASAGTRNGSVAVSVAANQLSITRSATLTIAGRTVTVTQGAMAPVTVTSLTSSVGFPAPAGTPFMCRRRWPPEAPAGKCGRILAI